MWQTTIITRCGSHFIWALGGMKPFSFLISTIFCVLYLNLVFVRAEVIPFTLYQDRDHTTPLDHSTFSQRYWMNEVYYKPNGPTIVYLNNFAAPNLDLQSSAISNWGEDLGALLLELEVRYSGSSNPSTNFTEATFNFQSPEQNLGDIITFRQTFLAANPQYSDSPWILVGVYFNANYALWAREKYPNVILGSVGIGGAVEALPEFPDYFHFWETVAGNECAAAIHNATEATELAFDINPIQIGSIMEAFGCDDVPDVTQFFYVVSQVLAYGLSSQRQFVCDTMTNTTSIDNVGQRYATVISTLLTASGMPDCNAWNIAGDLDPSQNYRPTFYLDCAYLGQFETAGQDTPTTMISHKITKEWYRSICSLLFDALLVPNTEQTNIIYGGKEMWGSNYAYVSSLSNPFDELGINATTLPNSGAIRVITIESLFEFLSGKTSTKNIEEGRDEVLALMKSWLPELPSASPSLSASASNNSPYDSAPDDSEWFVIVFCTFGALFVVVILFVTIGAGIYMIWKRNQSDVSAKPLLHE